MPLSLALEKHKGFYAIPLFEALGVRALFTTRRWDMGFEGCERLRAYKALGIRRQNLVCPSQVHGVTVAIVGKAHRGRGALGRSDALPATDALITAQRHLPLAVLTADCLPVFILDPTKKALGLVHAGWRGVHKKIIAAAVRQMRRVFSVKPRELLVALGPSLRPCCYEVGREFLSYFPSDVAARGWRFYLDLAQAACRQLAEAGVAEGHVLDSRICTSCSSREFFSYRKEGARAGRSMSLLEAL